MSRHHALFSPLRSAPALFILLLSVLFTSALAAPSITPRRLASYTVNAVDDLDLEVTKVTRTSSFSSSGGGGDQFERVTLANLGAWKGIVVFIGTNQRTNGYLFDPVNNNCMNLPDYLNDVIGVALIKGKCCSVYQHGKCQGQAYGDMCAPLDQSRDTFFDLPEQIGWSSVSCRDNL